ncbi:hypothetical protein MTQ13_19515 [Streptomyces sp. XM4011]|uniref:hypothetical protein n=1 Tax=Streptomyces TaxID=1883 RepID=UPI001FF74DB0|nr:hypothetical protein [Streptomyces sp. XM4011]MCK1816440.1 hypothetical protein [Streptomyces sp. XM4011]
MRRGIPPVTTAPPPAAGGREGGRERERDRDRNRAEEGLLRTEFAFELPRGYVDPSGTVHRSGVMRLATARDELVPLRDDRVRENSAYLSVVLISRVITRLGTIEDIHPGVVEDLFASDLAFLQDFYRRINSEGHTRAAVTCPSCREGFTVDLAGGGRLGES